MEEKETNVIEVQEESKVDGDRGWCVYCHTNKTNGKKYFGITSQNVEARWRHGFGYQNQIVFWRAIKKYGWDGFNHEVVMDSLTEDEAKQAEIELIKLYKTNCSKYNHPAYGYNMTDGGDGSTGRVLSIETRQRIGKAVKGKMVGEKNPFFGQKHTEETRNKMKENHYDCSGANSHRSFPVYCVELQELFWGCRDASNKYGIHRNSIGSCCIGKYTYAGKHPITGEPLHWLYVFDKQFKDNRVAQGAITLGYITEEQVQEYLNNLKQKGE